MLTDVFVITAKSTSGKQKSAAASTQAAVTSSTHDSAQTTSAAAVSAGATSSDNGKSQAGNQNSTSHHGTKTTSIDPRLPPGGVEMLTPAPIAGSQYFKIGDYVTFAWNYTSLSVTPSYIDVMASCSVNNQLYTIALNQSVEPTGAVTWDTGAYQASATIPLLTETYTLVIYDASKDVNTIPSAGYLGTFDQYQFGMYIPQPYTPLNEFQCATCNAALSAHERQALGFVLITAVVTALSFTWFANGFGVFS